MEPQRDANIPALETPTPETPTLGIPTSEIPTLESPTSETPIPETPTPESPIPEALTLEAPTLGTPPDAPAGPGNGRAGRGSGEAAAQDSGLGSQGTENGERDAREAGGDPKGEATGDGEGDARGTRGGAEAETAENATEFAGGATGGAGGDARAEAPEGAAGGLAAVGSTRGQQEPTWLQDDEEELWPEFPPCLSPRETNSCTSPPAGTTKSSRGSKRVALVGGSRAQAPSGTARPRPRLEGAGGLPRVSARAQGRSAILEKFGGAATEPAPHLKRAGGMATVKAMLLEWCRARTRGYQHVEVQNFSGSWGSGLAFCALLHSFFPDAFDYSTLEPGARQRNFTLAFATAEERAGCAPLLEVEDMVQMPVPDAKCVYTYLQELYRCLVAKGLVKTKKR